MFRHRLVGGVSFVAAILAAPVHGGEPVAAVGQMIIIKRPDCPVLLDYKQKPPQVLGRTRIGVQVVAVEGDWLRVHALKGMGWVHRRDAFTVPEALTHFTARIMADSKDADAWARRGMAHLSNQKLDEAFRDLSEAIRLHPAASECFHIRSIIWLVRRDTDRAMADLAEAARLDPANGQVLSDQATLWGMKGDQAKMKACVAEALRLDPACADAYCHRAMLWEDAHDDVRALADYTKAIECNSGHGNSYLNRALLHFRHAQYDAVIQDLTTALPLFKDPAHAYHLRAEAWLAKREPDKALTDIGQALAIYPTHNEALATRAKAMRMKGTSNNLPYQPPPVAAAEPMPFTPQPRPLEFTKYVSAEGRFQAEFPGPVQHGTVPVPDTDNRLTMKFAGTAVSFDLAYQITYCDYPLGMIHSPPQKFLEQLRDRSKGGLLQDTAIAFKDDLRHPGEALPGRESLIKENRYRRQRMILDGTRLYSVQIIGTREAVTSAEADHFIKSFRITP